jgi:flagellar biosynthesis/type III secretory pathway protein FliH
MNKDIMELLEAVSESLNRSRKVPFADDLYFVPKGEIIDIIAEIKSNFPREVSSAKQIVDNANEYVRKAKEDGARIIEAANARAERLVQSEEIVLLAKQKEREIAERTRVRANEIMSKANQAANEIQHQANVYLENALRKAEEALATSVTEVRSARQSLRR